MIGIRLSTKQLDKVRNGTLLASHFQYSTLAFEEFAFVPSKPTNISSDENQNERQTAVVIHGLFGAGRNWRTPAKLLGQSLSSLNNKKSQGWRIVLLDLRNHGRSAQLANIQPPHSISAAAADVIKLIEEKGWRTSMILGHSLGGKVALEVAKSTLMRPLMDLKQVWVLDSIPGISSEVGEVEHVIETLRSFPQVIQSRRWLLDELNRRGFSRGLSDWISSNLQRQNSSPEEMTWIFNVEGAAEMYESYKAADYEPFLQSPPSDLSIDFVRAENSDRWKTDIVQRLEEICSKSSSESPVRMHILPKAGHWLHTDNPNGLNELLLPSFIRLSSQDK